MAEVRARTVCARCGAQPVDFHRDEHTRHPLWRLNVLTGIGATIPRLKREIELCEPLCRRCHMTVDGRLRRAIEKLRKLTLEQVVEIQRRHRSRLRFGSGCNTGELAREFGVREQAIRIAAARGHASV